MVYEKRVNFECQMEAIIRSYCRPGVDQSHLLAMKSEVLRVSNYALFFPVRRSRVEEDAFRAKVISEVNQSVRSYEEDLKRLSVRTGCVWKRRSGKFTYTSLSDGKEISPAEYRRKYYSAMDLH